MAKKNDATSKPAPVEVDGAKAREMFVASGKKAAKDWNDARLLGKLASLTADGSEFDPGKYRKLYSRIVEANAAGAEIVLAGSAPTADEKKAEPAAEKKAGGKKAGGKKAPAKPAAKQAAERDGWGCRKGAGPAEMNKEIAKGKSTAADVAKKTGLKPAFVAAHVATLTRKGFVKRNDEGTIEVTKAGKTAWTAA